MKKQKKEKINKPKTEREIKAQIKGRKKLITLAICCGALIVLLVIFAFLKKSAAVSEFMATKVARGIIEVMGRVSSAVPFSMYELLLYLAGIAIIGGLAAIITLLIRKKFVGSLRILASLALAALIVGNVYFVSAGFSYNRHEEYFPVYSPSLTKQQTIALADYFLDDLSSIAVTLERDEKGYAVMPYSMAELSSRLRIEYLRLEGYNINRYTPACKTIYSSGIMSEMGIYGVFFAPFGEANINGCMPVYDIPFTMAHEMAHSKGVMLEPDANNVALYITLTSSDPFIRYSGYSYGIYTFLDAVLAWEMAEGSRELSEYYRLLGKVSPWLKTDFKSNNDFYEKYNKMEKLGELVSKINDVYLKIMGQKEGTDGYLPPGTAVIDKPVKDPDGNPVTDPSGKPVVVREPEYNIVQQIFFRAYLEETGEEI